MENATEERSRISFPVVKIYPSGTRGYIALAGKLRQKRSLVPDQGRIEVGGEVTLILFDRLPERDASKLWQQREKIQQFLRGQRCSSTRSGKAEVAAFFLLKEGAGEVRIVLTPKEQAHIFAHLLLPFAAQIAKDVCYLEDRALVWGGQHAPAVVFNAGFQPELMADLVGYFWHWLGQLIHHGRFPSPARARADLAKRWATLGWEVREKEEVKI